MQKRNQTVRNRDKKQQGKETCLLKMLKYMFNRYQIANMDPSCKVLIHSSVFVTSFLLSGTAADLTLKSHDLLPANLYSLVLLLKLEVGCKEMSCL